MGEGEDKDRIDALEMELRNLKVLLGLEEAPTVAVELEGVGHPVALPPTRYGPSRPAWGPWPTWSRDIPWPTSYSESGRPSRPSRGRAIPTEFCI